MQDLINELNEYRQNLDRAIGNLETRGKIKAKMKNINKLKSVSNVIYV